MENRQRSLFKPQKSFFDNLTETFCFFFKEEDADTKKGETQVKSKKKNKSKLPEVPSSEWYSDDGKYCKNVYNRGTWNNFCEVFFNNNFIFSKMKQR
jgi:hypothetical protein